MVSLIKRPWEERVEVKLQGWWSEGGPLKIWVDGKEAAAIDLPRREWAAMAILLNATRKAEELNWSPPKIPPAELARQLKNWHLGNGLPDTAYAVMLKLRNRLDATGLQKKLRLASGFGHSLILRGYRLALPAASLELLLSDPALLMCFDPTQDAVQPARKTLPAKDPAGGRLTRL